MKPNTDEAKELFKLAERDRLAFDTLVTSEDIHVSMPLFHAQQYVEKVMEAVLVTHGAVFRRTHDLLELAGLLQRHGLPLPIEIDFLSRLNPYAVTSRYAIEDTEVLTISEGIQIVNAVQHWITERKNWQQA